MVEPIKKFLSKVILIGDMNVGKTTLISSYTSNNTGNKNATMGPDFRKKDLKIGNVEVNM